MPDAKMPPATQEWPDYEHFMISLEEIAQILRSRGRSDVARLIDKAAAILDAREAALDDRETRGG